MATWDDDALRACLQGDDTDAQLEAAEVVAAAAGFPGDELTDDDRAAVDARGVPGEDLVELALRTVKDLCADETDDATLEQLRDLRFRLGDAAAP
jgi:hypothetical protein